MIQLRSMKKMICGIRFQIFMILIVSTGLVLLYFVPIINYLHSTNLKQKYYRAIANYLQETYRKQIMGEANDTASKRLLSTEDTANKRLLLTVGVLSKLSATERRMAIRTTWFKVCKDNVGKVACKFFTDLPLDNEAHYYDEKTEYSDLEYMPYRGGMNFALQLLWMLKYFTRNYDFDFFLRVDDDYFVCLQHLLTELPQRPTTALYWGWVHCYKDIVRIDEGFMILTRDIIEESLERYNTSLMCSAAGDQAVALWVTNSTLNVTYFYDNDRLVHIVDNVTVFLRSGVCDRYIGLHQAYPEYMYQYWRLMRYDKAVRREKLGISAIESYHIPAIPEFLKMCSWGKTFNWRGFHSSWTFEPKPCRYNPRWSNDFQGRQQKKTYN